MVSMNFVKIVSSNNWSGPGKIGLIHLNRGAYDEAVQYFTRYLELSEELGYARGTGFALGNLATVHFQQTVAVRQNEKQTLFQKRDCMRSGQ